MHYFLDITEIFKSVQGETTFSGLPTTFIRLARCHLRCSWCDTSYSFKKGKPYSLQEIIREVVSHKTTYVCITGGEPLLQKNVHLLMSSLADQDFKVSLETSGSLSVQDVDPRVTIILDIKCPSSKMAEKNHWVNFDLLKPADEIKFVIQDKDDYTYAKAICEQYQLFHKSHPLLFSPVHGVLNNRELVQWILKDNLPVRLNLQIHKYIWDPLTRGV